MLMGHTSSTKNFLGSASQGGASNGVKRNCSCGLFPAAFEEAALGGPKGTGLP